jgi:DNA-binding phage protein
MRFAKRNRFLAVLARLSTLVAVVKAVGLKLTAEAA